MSVVVRSVEYMMTRLFHRLHYSIICGGLIATLAICIRLSTSVNTTGRQAVFSYPAVVLATYLFGMRAGAVAGLICLIALWYYVIPIEHSFVIADLQAAITLLLYIVLGILLVWAIGMQRRSLARYRKLNIHLEQIVLQRTAERNRFWDRSCEQIAILTAEGTIQAVNPSFSALFGASAESLAACSFADLMNESDRARIVELLRSLGSVHRHARFETDVLTSAGESRIAWSAVYDGDLSYVVGQVVASDAGDDVATRADPRPVAATARR